MYFYHSSTKSFPEVVFPTRDVQKYVYHKSSRQVTQMCTELPNHDNDTGIENVGYLLRQSRVLLG